MNLKTKFINKTPREKSGSSTSNRYDFQKNWAICLLINCHKPQADYLIFLDYHEDIVFLNSENNPSKADFYQIKSKKNGTWTLSSLIKSKKNSFSIMGKLYDNLNKFKEETNTINFVSNAFFNIPLEKQFGSSLEKDNISITMINDESKTKLINALKSEYKINKIEALDNLINLQVTDLSLDNSSTHTKGKLAEFIEQLNPHATYNIGTM